jgi:hypothetical protein
VISLKTLPAGWQVCNPSAIISQTQIIYKKYISKPSAFFLATFKFFKLHVGYLYLLDFITDDTVDLLTNNWKSCGWVFCSCDKNMSHWHKTRIYMNKLKSSVSKGCEIFYSLNIKLQYIFYIYRQWSDIWGHDLGFEIWSPWKPWQQVDRSAIINRLVDRLGSTDSNRWLIAKFQPIPNTLCASV